MGSNPTIRNINKLQNNVFNHLLSLKEPMSETPMSLSTKQSFITGFSSIGIIYTMLEIISYAILFYHMNQHNNKVASSVVKPSVVKQRNKSNAVSMVGQFAGWVMEIWYVLLIGLLSGFYNMEKMREFSSLVKDLEFVLIPLVEIYTSLPIRNFISNNQNVDKNE